MFLAEIPVPPETRLQFQPQYGPLTHHDEYYDLGLVLQAQEHADEVIDAPEQWEDARMVLECEGVEASELTRQLHWPSGETIIPGKVRFAGREYPATLQVRPRNNGLRAILRSVG